MFGFVNNLCFLQSSRIHEMTLNDISVHTFPLCRDTMDVVKHVHILQIYIYYTQYIPYIHHIVHIVHTLHIVHMLHMQQLVWPGVTRQRAHSCQKQWWEQGASRNRAAERHGGTWYHNATSRFPLDSESPLGRPGVECNESNGVGGAVELAVCSCIKIVSQKRHWRHGFKGTDTGSWLGSFTARTGLQPVNVIVAPQW